MGNFYKNLTLKGRSEPEVAAALDRYGRVAFVMPQKSLLLRFLGAPQRAYATGICISSAESARSAWKSRSSSTSEQRVHSSRNLAEERHSGEADPARKRDGDRESEPTHEEIERDGKRAAATAQEKLLEDSDGRKRPDDTEQGVAHRAPKGVQGKWRIGPGDEKVDARVIELSKDRLRPAAQRVIERREQIQRHERDAIDGEAQGLPRVRLAHRDPDERDKADRRQDRADEVAHAVEDSPRRIASASLRMLKIGREAAEIELLYLFAKRVAPSARGPFCQTT